jgi:hypothetical protein
MATMAAMVAKLKTAVLVDGSMRAAANPTIPIAAAYVAGKNSNLQVRCMFWYSTHTAELKRPRNVGHPELKIFSFDLMRRLCVCAPERLGSGNRCLGIFAQEASDLNGGIGPAQVVKDAGECPTDIPGLGAPVRRENLSWRYSVQRCPVPGSNLMWPRRLRVAHDEKPLWSKTIRRIGHDKVVPLPPSAMHAPTRQ